MKCPEEHRLILLGEGSPERQPRGEESPLPSGPLLLGLGCCNSAAATGAEGGPGRVAWIDRPSEVLFY